MTTLMTKALLIGKRVDENGRKIFTYKASTSATDRQGEIVTTDGWRIDNYQRNPVILDCHNYGTIRAIVGKAIETRTPADGPEVDVVYAPTEAGQDAEKLADGGFLNAVSVGFRSLKREPGNKGEPLKHTEKELLEVSMVSVPANPEALRLRTILQARDLDRLAGAHPAGDGKAADFDATLDLNERLSALYRRRYQICNALDTANGGALGDENLSADGKINAIDRNLGQFHQAMLAWYREALELRDVATQNGLEIYLGMDEDGVERRMLAEGPAETKAGRKLSKATIGALRETADQMAAGAQRLHEMCDEVEGAAGDGDPPEDSDKGKSAGAPPGESGAGGGPDDDGGDPGEVTGLSGFADALRAFVGTK